jgi:para-nitrobenzyl esterase
MTWCGVAAAVALAATAAWAPAAGAVGLPDVIQTSDGPVSGEVDDKKHPTLTSFKGIPFAAPPTKGNRFLLPQPVAKWTDVYKATEGKAPCLQADLVKFGHLGEEDCLYLDVCIPTSSLCRLFGLLAEVNRATDSA